MPGARRARSLACENKKAHERSHHGYAGSARHSLRNGFNGFLRALLGDRAFLPPSLARSSPRKLGISVGMPGPHDFAVRDRRIRLVRQRVHRIPHPTSVTIAKRPSCGRGTAGNMVLIWGQAKAKYFLLRDWTTQIILKVLMFSRLCRTLHLVGEGSDQEYRVGSQLRARPRSLKRCELYSRLCRRQTLLIQPLVRGAGEHEGLHP